MLSLNLVLKLLIKPFTVTRKAHLSLLVNKRVGLEMHVKLVVILLKVEKGFQKNQLLGLH